VLGPDAEAGSETYELFLKDVLRDMTQKAGQKCTAIRRVLVPAGALERTREDLVERLRGVAVGNPAHEAVRMGPVATAAQLEDVRRGIGELAADGRVVLGGATAVQATGVEAGRGFFVPPTLLEIEAGAAAPTVHGREVFGPVATVVPYSGRAEEAAEVVARGSGGLVSSVYSDDPAFMEAAVMGLAPYHGRIFLGSPKIAELSPGPGTVLPQLVHGGPGRAGGGEELGGPRGLAFYMQRVALEVPRPMIERIALKRKPAAEPA
jgi:3,4-dehydroadipyl-CoA semialdehyde dehydrogenase